MHYLILTLSQQICQGVKIGLFFDYKSDLKPIKGI